MSIIALTILLYLSFLSFSSTAKCVARRNAGTRFGLWETETETHGLNARKPKPGHNVGYSTLVYRAISDSVGALF